MVMGLIGFKLQPKGKLFQKATPMTEGTPILNKKIKLKPTELLLNLPDKKPLKNQTMISSPGGKQVMQDVIIQNPKQVIINDLESITPTISTQVKQIKGDVEFPYGLEIAINTDRLVKSIDLTMEFDSEIKNLNPVSRILDFIIPSGVNHANIYRTGTFNNAMRIILTQTRFFPEQPIVAKIYSNRDFKLINLKSENPNSPNNKLIIDPTPRIIEVQQIRQTMNNSPNSVQVVETNNTVVVPRPPQRHLTPEEVATIIELTIKYPGWIFRMNVPNGDREVERYANEIEAVLLSKGVRAQYMYIVGFPHYAPPNFVSSPSESEKKVYISVGLIDATP